MMKYLNSLIPVILALAFTVIIFIPINNKFNISNKIAPVIPTTPKFKPLFFTVATILLLLIIGLLGLYVVPMSNFVYYILTGIVAGIGISITVELSPKHHK